MLTALHRELLRYELGLVSGQVLPGLAVNALEEGLDSSALRILAAHALCAYDAWGVMAAYADARDDFGVSLPARADALRLLLESLLSGIVTGELDPYLGATQVVDEIHRACEGGADDARVAGDALGIERLIGLVYGIQDLLESDQQLQHPVADPQLVLTLASNLREEACRLVAPRPWRRAPPAAR